MKKEEFREWLITVNQRNAAQTSDHISRVKRIETAFSTLDQHPVDVEMECQKDGCVSIMERLSVTGRKAMPNDINLPSDRLGISRLKSSLRKYIDFYNWKSLE